MPIAVYINETRHVEPLIGWGIRSAIADHNDLLVIVPRRQKGEPKWDPLEKSEAEEHEIFQAVFDTIAKHSDRVSLKQDVAENLESSSMDQIIVETRELIAPVPAEALVDKVAELNLTRLIIPAGQLTSDSDEDSSWTQRLFQQSPCEVMMVWGSPPAPHEALDVVVVADADTESALTVRRGCQLSHACQQGKTDVLATGSTLLLYVQPDSDLVSSQLAGRKAASILSRSGSGKSHATQKVHLGTSIVEAVKEQEIHDQTLIMMGTRSIKKIRSLAKGLQGKDGGPPMAVIRPPVSVSRKVLREFQTRIRSIVPQLTRDERVSLVEKLEPNSKFNFDFCALISLSTLIAALGLADNSTAVVIGAMLVAPLMTPLVGIGFSLIQGNFDLVQKARNAVLIGFANAFAIGVFVGLLCWLLGVPISTEMAARDSPSFLDLFVALASGLAGAYATSRKGLNGAIPGVAIAAALVPPIATSGMAMAMGNWSHGFGALLLFLTNIVFIVLGTAIVFWAVGIDTRETKDKSKSGKRKWTRYWFAAFVLASLLLAAWMGTSEYSNYKLEKQKERERIELLEKSKDSAAAPPVTTDDTPATPNRDN